MNEKITIEEALRRGYKYGPIGYNHAQNKTVIAPLTMIKRFSCGCMFPVNTLDSIADDLCEPEPNGDIPLDR